MIDVTRYRSNELEITEADLSKTRENYILYFKILLAALIVFSIVFFRTGDVVLDLIIVIVKFVLITTIIVFLVSVIQELKMKDLAAVKLYFREGRVRDFYKLERVSIFSNTFFETEVRFNQAVGFRVVAETHLTHSTLLWVLKNLFSGESDYFYGYVIEIIYDPHADGIPVFRTYYPETVVQFLAMMSQLLPDKEIRQYYAVTKQNSSEDVPFLGYDEMDEEEKEEFQKEMIVLPEEFREFMKEKYRIL